MQHVAYSLLTSLPSIIIYSELFVNTDAGENDFESQVALFFTSYYLIGSVVLLNVVVAVLLDEFISAMISWKSDAAERQRIEREKKNLSGVVDPLTRTLMSYSDEEDLNARIDHMYDRLDADGGGSLSYQELCMGFKRMGIHLSYDDWEVLTGQGRLTDESDCFDRVGFREIMRGELWRFMRREVTNMGQSGSAEFKVHQIWQKLLDSKLNRLMHEVEVVELNLPRRREIAGSGQDQTAVAQPSTHPKALAGQPCSGVLGSSTGGAASADLVTFHTLSVAGVRGAADGRGEDDRISQLAHMIAKQSEAQAEGVRLMGEMMDQLRGDLDVKLERLHACVSKLVNSKYSEDSTMAAAHKTSNNAAPMLDMLPPLNSVPGPHPARSPTMPDGRLAEQEKQAQHESPSSEPRRAAVLERALSRRHAPARAGEMSNHRIHHGEEGDRKPKPQLTETLNLPLLAILILLFVHMSHARLPLPC